MDLGSGEGIAWPWDPKDSDREVRALGTIFIKGGILFKKKKKKSNIFYKRLSFSGAVTLHLNDGEQSHSKVDISIKLLSCKI